MSIKLIYVPLPDAEGAEATIAAALKIAARLGAEVEVAHLAGDPVQTLGDFAGEAVSPQLVEEILAQAEKRAKVSGQAARKAFDAAVTDASAVKSRFSDVKGASDVVVERQGRLSDLIVVRRGANAKDVGARAITEIALMTTGRPVLVAPLKARGAIGTNIAIAWNDSLEASRAVAVALPFLTRAAKVTVISAKDDRAIDQKNIISYLARHGVKAEGVSVRAGSDAGKAIVAAAIKAGSDLLVMGAYSHSRVREMIFGGVTEHALSSARLPVLLLH